MGLISRIWKTIATGYKLFLASVEILRITYAADDTTIEGSGATGKGLVLKANSVDAISNIGIGANITMDVTSAFALKLSGISIGYFGGGASDFMIYSYSNRNIALLPNGTGRVSFGTEITNAGSDRGKLVNFLLADGTSVHLKTYDTV